MVLHSTWRTCFDDPPATPPEGGGGGGEGGGAGKPQTFSQEDVNKMIAAERRKLQSKNDEMAAQLKKLGESAKMTDEERQQLQQKIEQLETEHLSASEKARRDSETAKKKYDEQLSGVTRERDEWRNRHSEAVITNAIMGAASREETRAFQPADLIAHLRPLTALEPVEGEDGNVSGYEPKVKLPDVDKDGKPVVLICTVDEAVARMTELDRYKHLFVSTAKGGAGASGSTGTAKTGKVDVEALARDPVAYREWRQKVGLAGRR